jgi:large subunit ribosomal protein L32e
MAEKKSTAKNKKTEGEKTKKPVVAKKTTSTTKKTTTKKQTPKKDLKDIKKTSAKKEEKPKAEPKKTKKKTTVKKEKSKTKKPTKKTEEKKEEKEPVKEKEEEKYQVKKKPKLSKDIEKQLIIRKQIKKRTPNLLREEWFRYKRIPKNWRRPDGITSKMRINLKYRPSKVRVGYRGPKNTRGLHSSGFKEVLVYNINDLERIDPKTQAARIGSSVGTKKRMDIEKKAEELEIRVLNI